MTAARTESNPAAGARLDILFVAPWDQEFGGVSSVVTNLARDLEGRGHGVVLLHPGEPQRPTPRKTVHGFRGYQLNLRSPLVPRRRLRSLVAFLVYLVPTLYHLRRIVHAHRIRVVNVHYPVEASVYFGLLRFLLPVKLVVSVHGADLFPMPAGPPKRRWSIRFLLRCADVIVAPSAAYLRDCAAVYPKAFRRGVCIHNGVDPRELAATGTVSADEGGNDPFILCIAAHNEKKAIDVLLRAFVPVSAAERRVKLVLLGDGPLRPQLEDQVRRLSLGERVVFMGQQGRAEVSRLLRACRVFVLPSRSEPFGMVVVEALLSRRPVVASAVGGIAEIIEDGRSGLLVEAEDDLGLARAILRVLNDPKLGAALSENGYARAMARFTSEQMGGRYERMFSRISSDSPSPVHS